MKLLKQIDDNIERWLCLVFYTMIIATICLEVLQRFLLSYSSIWGEEIARFSFIYLAWLGAAYAVKERAHLRIDFFVSNVPNRVKALLYIAAGLLALALAALALYLSLEPIRVSLKFSSVTHGLRVPRSIFLMAIPVGFLLIAYRIVRQIIADVGAFLSGEPVFVGQGIAE